MIGLLERLVERAAGDASAAGVRPRLPSAFEAGGAGPPAGVEAEAATAAVPEGVHPPRPRAAPPPAEGGALPVRPTPPFPTPPPPAARSEHRGLLVAEPERPAAPAPAGARLAAPGAPPVGAAVTTDTPRVPPAGSAPRHDAPAARPPDAGHSTAATVRPAAEPATIVAPGAAEPRAPAPVEPRDVRVAGGDPRRAEAPGAIPEAEAPRAPVIRVSIGRIEVRAVTQPPPARPPPSPRRAEPALSLDDYLRQRRAGAR